MSLAAQTLSASTAKALDFVRDLELKGFEDVDPTILFVQTIDHLFDVLNSRRPNALGYKSPISLRNLRKTEEFLEIARELLCSIQVNGKDILSTNKNTGFIGFIFCIDSFIALSKELLSSNMAIPMRYVMGYSFSQDHLELLFNSIRGTLGWNNNPTPKQFQYIVRRLHAHVGVTGDSSGNCINFSDDIEVMDVIEEPEGGSNPPPSLFVRNAITYIAGFVIRKYLRHESCSDCRASLVASPNESLEMIEDQYFLTLKNNGGLLIPSSDVVKVLKLTESTFAALPLRKKTKQNVYTQVVNNIASSLFCTPHMLDTDHRSKLIRSLVYIYCDLRAFHVAKQVHLKRTNYARPRLTKRIHFLSQ